MKITNSYIIGSAVHVAGFVKGLGKRTIILDVNQSKKTFKITNLIGLVNNLEVMKALKDHLEEKNYFIEE